MTTAQQAEVCRITVHGPGGRVDLAVPLSVPVANLIPVLLRRAGDRRVPVDQRAGWVLQRLGDPALDPSGTPETLNWRDGEEFHLRLATDPLPELDFDDIADGVATAVSRQPGRWRPEYNRWLFFGLFVAALVVVARGLLFGGAWPVSTATGVALGAAFVVGSIAVDRRSGDRMPTLLFGIAGGLFAGLGAATWPAGPEAAAALDAGSVLAGGVGMAVAAAILLTARGLTGSTVPIAPYGVLLASGVLAALTQWLHIVVGMTSAEVAGSLCTVLLILLAIAPRLSLRLARIEGPQLPRTADELQRDLEPLPAKEVVARTRDADGLLTVAVVTSAIGYICSFPFLVADGLFGTIMALLVALAAVLRARGFHSAWQKVPLAVAGGVGAGVAGLALVTLLGPQARGVALVVLCVIALTLLAAMLRPPARRMRPVWGHVANIGETLVSVAVLPVLLQLFDVYAQARGLAG